MTAFSAGSGADALVMNVSQHAWRGDAKFSVLVDGKQVGGTFTAYADQRSGQFDTLTLKGDWAAGAHKVEVRFLNDAYGGTAATDRNLFVDRATYNGVDLGVDLDLYNSQPKGFSFTDAPSAPAPVVQTVGAGADALVLRVSQDAWQGSAQYTVSVDGKQVGGTLTAGALRSSDLTDTITVKGDWAAGTHKVEVKLLNDAYGGSAAADRNLFVEGATYNGADLRVDIGIPDARPGAFSFTEAAAPTAPTAPPAAGEFGSTPIWSDEFNGAAIDRRKWTNLFDGPSWDNGNVFDWTEGQLSVSNGMLNIGLARQPDGRWDVGGMAAYERADGSGFGFQYGKVEIRAKASQEIKGAGMCFLLWPEKDDHWPPEIDILETPAGDGLFTNHWQGPGGNGDNEQEDHRFALDYDRWHVYGLEWTPDRITMTVDGREVKTLTTHVAAEPMSVALMGYVGSPSQTWYGGSPDPAGPGRMDISVDYVRVYDHIG